MTKLERAFLDAIAQARQQGERDIALSLALQLEAVQVRLGPQRAGLRLAA